MLRLHRLSWQSYITSNNTHTQCCVARLGREQVSVVPPLQVGTATSMPFRCQPILISRARHECESPVAVDAKAAASAAEMAA